MAENELEVVVPPLTASNPVDQALTWVGFRTGGNCNRIRDEGGLEVFDNVFGLNERDI